MCGHAQHGREAPTLSALLALSSQAPGVVESHGASWHECAMTVGSNRSTGNTEVLLLVLYAGPVFLAQRAELESVYRVYCQNHDEAIALLETYEKDEKIQKLLVDLLDNLRLEPLTVVTTKLG